ncbi:hypothetical protein Tco_0639519 [Tanacetum coccineum]
MRPFGCPLTILNTLDSLGKFDGKSDEGYLLGYSTSSKAFRVYNKRTKRVKENLHINFLEDQPNVSGTGPNWMFDLDFLTNSMNYIPVSVENQVNVDAGTQDSYVAEVVAKALEDATRQVFEEEKRNVASQKRTTQATSTNKLSTVRSSISTATKPYVSAISTPTGANADESSFVYLGGKIPVDASTLPNTDLPIDPNMPDLEDDSDAFASDGIFNGAYDDENVGAVADFNNYGDPKSAVQTRGKIQKASSAQQALVSYISKQNRTNHKDHQNCLLACFLSQEEPKNISQSLQRWKAGRSNARGLPTFKFNRVGLDRRKVYDYDEFLHQLSGIEANRLYDPAHPNKVYKVNKALYWSSSSPRAWYETLSSFPDENGFFRRESIVTEFEDCMHKRFQMSSMGELAFLLGLQVKQQPDRIFIIQDKPNIHVCCPAPVLEFQVTPKASHLNAVKRIFRYLKHQPKLGLWYPRDSPFEILKLRIQTIMANSTTEAEYVAAANCCGQVLWIQNQMMDYGFNFMNTKIHIDNESTISVIKNPVAHSRTKHIEIRFHFIRDCYEKRLIEVIKIHTDHNVADLLTKGFDVTRFNFLVVIKALYGLHQAPRAWYETLSSFLIENGYRRGTIDKTLFIKKKKSDIITATTPIESNKPLVKDEDGVDVDVHVYRSMIRSLMYLTASRPYIMFAICACARFQVTPKASHLNVVKRIFRRFISWQCKKQIIMENSTTEAEYVAAANCWNVTPLFESMLVQPTEDKGEALERQSEPQLTPSPLHPSADQHEIQPYPYPRPSPTILIPDSIPEGSGRNHGGQSSSDRSLSGNKDGLTL